jgi:MOSC domain-containing protein YiiM
MWTCHQPARQTDRVSEGRPYADAVVTAVSRDHAHSFSKPVQQEIRLVAGLGVEGDAHFGSTVQHLSRVKRDPTQPNLRQVHLVAAETHDDLAARGFAVGAGQLGENVTTRGLDLFGLPTGTLLQLGDSAVIEVTGLRSPCFQLDRLQDGLMKALLPRDDEGNTLYRAGIMAVVLEGAIVRPGDAIGVTLPSRPHRPLERV